MSRTDENASADAWLSASRKGFCELSSGHVQTALSHWHEAAQTLASEEAFDPRLAAAKNNVGVGCLLLLHQAEAKAVLDEALNLWRQVRDRVEAMDVPVAGRSSSFHFKLATDHTEAFKEAGRKRYEQSCDAAIAITRFNVCLAEHRRLEQSDYRAAVESLASGFGSGCPEISALNSLSQDPCGTLPDDRTNARLFGMYGEKLRRGAASAQAGWQEPLTDAQKLEAAAHMTALCDPRLCAEPRSHNDRFDR